MRKGCVGERRKKVWRVLCVCVCVRVCVVCVSVNFICIDNFFK